MGSVQLDFQLPIRFDLRYISSDGGSRAAEGRPTRPVMVHRALLGSFERFIGILIEHFGGRFPLWLAPEAVRVIPVGADQAPYAEEVAGFMAEGGVRCVVVEAGSLGKRIRDARALRIPVLAIVGPREAAERKVTLRRSERQNVASLQHAVAALGDEVIQRGR